MLRDLAKAAVRRLANTRAGMTLVHAALEGDRRASRFSEVEDWPATVDGFEDLDFLFTSSQLDHGVASLRFDEAALLFRLVRTLAPGPIVELGRFKGGSTFVIAAAMAPGSTLRSYDLHVGLTPEESRTRDAEIRSALERFGLDRDVELIVGDTRSVELPAEPLALLFVDADHAYSSVRADVERWSPLVRSGGHVLLHDAVDTGGWGTTFPGAARLLDELAHLCPELGRENGAGTIAHFVRR